eukprot:403332895
MNQSASKDQNQVQQQKSSNYQGSLASQKFFTPKELNALNLSKKPDQNNKKVIKEELKKPIGPVKVNHQMGVQFQNSNAQSQALALYEINDQFLAKTQHLDQEQQRKLENLNRRPFSTKSSRQGSRPTTAQINNDTSLNEKENNQSQIDNYPQIEFDNDLYEEIQVTDEDYIQRKNLMDKLDRREEQRGKLELDEIYNNLRSHVANEQDIDTLSQYSMKEIKEDKQINIYKPSLKGPIIGGNQKKQTQQQVDYVINEFPSPQLTSAKALQKQVDRVDFYPQNLVALPTGDTSNRLSQIQQQLLDLQKFKDEIMGDLDDFMDEMETQSLVTIPEQFDDVVDFVVNEERDKAEMLVQDRMQNDGKYDEEIYDDTGKPMWMQFFKEDYLGESKSQNLNLSLKNQGKEMSKKLNELTEKEQKMAREMEKIRKLDAQLAQQSKFQRDQKNQIMMKKQEEDRKEELAIYQKTEQSFDQSKQSRTQSSKGFETASNKKQVPQRGQSKGKPPSQSTQQRSVKKPASSQKQQVQNQQEEEDTDTFLTNALFKGNKQSKKKSSKGSSVKGADDDDSVDSDELNDVVYDYDQQVALMEMADDYLSKPLLSLPPIEEDSKSSYDPNRSTNSFRSNITSNKDFLSKNKDQAKAFNPYKKPMKCDQLDEESKNRLDSLMRDIDDNLEDIKKEKEDFYSVDINKSSYTNKIVDGKSAYVYSNDDIEKIEKINSSLMKMTPMLPAPDYYENQSVMKSNYDHSKFLSDDTHSMRSQPMSIMSRKSGFTMLSHQTFQTGVQSMPGEHSLKKQAEKRLLDIQMKKIDQNLRRINETDDLSYANQPPQLSDSKRNIGAEEMLNQLQPQKKLIDQETLLRLIEECQEDEERQSAMSEMNGDDSRTVAISGYNEKTQLQLAQIEKQSQLFNDAENVFKDLADVKEQYYQALDSIQERQNTITNIEQRVNNLFKKSEKSDQIMKSKQTLKDQLILQEDELNSIINNLETREEMMKNMKEKEDRDFEMYDQQIQQQVSLNQDLYKNLDDDDDKLEKILKDIHGYQQLEHELQQEAQEETERNQKMLQEIEFSQVNRNDDADEMLIFARKQLDIQQERDEEEAKQNSNPQEEML